MSKNFDAILTAIQNYRKSNLGFGCDEDVLESEAKSIGLPAWKLKRLSNLTYSLDFKPEFMEEALRISVLPTAEYKKIERDNVLYWHNYTKIAARPPHITPEHWQEWLDSGVSPGIIDANVRSVSGQEAIELICGSASEKVQNVRSYPTEEMKRILDRNRNLEDGGWWVEGLDPLANWEPMTEWGQLKPNTPRADTENPEKIIKYVTPEKVGLRAFFLADPTDDDRWQRAQSDTSPLILCEGAKKAGALISLGFNAIALPGIFSGRRVPKDASGNPLKDEAHLIPELEVMLTQPRPVVFCFDQDEKESTRDRVNQAIYLTGELLKRKGCSVGRCKWDSRSGKGIDDVLVKKGAEFVRNIIEKGIAMATNAAETEDKKIDVKVSSGLPQWEVCPHSVNHTLCRWETRGFGKNRYEVSVPIANFDFTIERVLQSESGGGLVLAVSRIVAGKLMTSRVIVDSQKDCGKPIDFANGIKRGLGVNVVCNMRSDELQALLAVRTEEYHTKGGQVYKLIDRIGQQEDGTWVFDTIQFTKDGQVTNEEETRWVFNPRLSEDDFIPCPLVHEPNPEAIKRLVMAAHKFYHEITFMHFLFACGWVAAGVNYQEIMKTDKCFPIYNPYGDKGSGKTTAVEAALSMVGWNSDEKRKGILAKSSVSALYERLKNISSLPQCWDDPTRGGRIVAAEFDETLKGLYGAAPRVVRGNTQQPRSALAVTSNHTMGDSSDATRSRLMQVYMPKLPVNGDAYPELADAMLQASGGFASLIAIGYPQEEIAALEKKIRPHLSQADQRISRSIALISYYAGKVADLAGIRADVQQFVIDVLCPVENDAQTTKDSLEDFIEKLSALQSTGSVGEWNTRLVETAEGKFLAVHMPSVWKLVDREYSPIYSQNVIRRLIEERGGQISSAQKFPLSQQLWQQYERERMQLSEDAEMSLKKPDMVSRRCVLVPLAIAGDLGMRFEADAFSYTRYSNDEDNCNQQDLDVERISGSSYSSYTSYIHTEEEEEEENANCKRVPDSEKSKNSSHMRAHFLETVTDVNDVTTPPETEPQQDFQQLQQDVTGDVTVLKNVTEPIESPSVTEPNGNGTNGHTPQSPIPTPEPIEVQNFEEF